MTEFFALLDAVNYRTTDDRSTDEYQAIHTASKGEKLDPAPSTKEVARLKALGAIGSSSDAQAAETVEEVDLLTTDDEALGKMKVPELRSLADRHGIGPEVKSKKDLTDALGEVRTSLSGGAQTGAPLTNEAAQDGGDDGGSEPGE